MKVFKDAVWFGKPGSVLCQETEERLRRQLRKSKRDSKIRQRARRVISPNLGEYPYTFITTNINVRVKRVIASLIEANKLVKDTSKLNVGTEFHSILEKYNDAVTASPQVFPFDNDDTYGLSVSKLKQAFNPVY